MPFDLDDLGEQYTRARHHLAAVKDQMKTAANQAAEAGMDEVQIAHRLKADRMTVRSWLGKPRKRTRDEDPSA